MREETRQMLDAMGFWPWFQHVAEPTSNESVIPVGSWQEAFDPKRQHSWECLRYQTRNITIESINALDWHRAQEWNGLVRSVKEHLKPLFQRVRAFGMEHSLPEGNFYHNVTWDLVFIAMEIEFADLYPPLFSAPALAPWYQAGHFPCGWDGPVLDTSWKKPLPPYRLYI